MDIRYRITGGTPLQGDVTIGGSKNAALPLMAASVLCEGDLVLHNVPRLRDTMAMLAILEFLGAQITVLEQMGAQNMSSEEVLHLQGTLQPPHVILPEVSVTATENVLMAAALMPGEPRVDLAACEPHVQDLQRLLVSMGAAIEG